MNVFGMGPLELILILALALIVFGPDKLPEIARQLGRTVAEIRRVSSEVTGELQRGLQLEDDHRITPRPTFQPPAPEPPTPPVASTPPSATPHNRFGGDDVRPPY
jgi:Tat protein translocase TatB subunit